MKKAVLIVMLLVGNIVYAFAQDTIVLYITDHPATMELCTNKTVLVYAEQNCNEWYWRINNVVHEENPIVIESLTQQQFNIQYYGCMGGHSFTIIYWETSVPSPYIHTEWKRQGYTETIEPVGVDSLEWYNYQWSTGETTSTINVVEPGTYTCEISDYCGSSIRTFIVRDNVELYRATVDLETNLNKATWQVTAEQAEYISEVKVYRDGLLVGSAPYEQGYFLDNIGSDNAARNYRIIGVSIEGEDCPIESYEKGTIHTTYYEDVNGNLNMTWNIPYVEEGAQGALTYFQICKYDPNTGEITVVDQVNSSITDYTCGVNQFDGGYAVIAAVFNDGKGVEELSFSNLTTDILGIEEDGLSTGLGTFTVYPNPAKDRVTIEGTGKAIITNALGQTILTKEIDGQTTVALPQGMYFVKLGNETRKIVVE